MFSLILPGRPCLTEPLAVSPNQYAFSFPSSPSFSHIVIFITPGALLPSGNAAAVYIQLPGQSEFKILGAIANEKQSAIFKINFHNNDETLNNDLSDGMMDASSAGPAQPGSGVINLGISIEPIPSIQAQLQSLERDAGSAAALVRRPPSTKVLAQRIIRNAFNFLASFAGGSGGQEMVPLKSFQDWWTKFERKIENDPTFLERDDGV